MFFTCLMGWFLTNCVLGGAELLLYDKTFFHWGDVLSIIFWGGLWLYLRLRRLEKQAINVNINALEDALNQVHTLFQIDEFFTKTGGTK